MSKVSQLLAIKGACLFPNVLRLPYNLACANISKQDNFKRSVLVTTFEELRTNAGLTITQLAKEADVSRATIEKIEKGLPVRATNAARACIVLSRYIGRQVTFQELGIKTVR